MWGLRRVHRNGHIAELLFTFGLALIIEKVVQMSWGLLPVPYRVPELLDFPLFKIYGTQFPAYRAFMLAISALMFGAIWLGLTRTRVGSGDPGRADPSRHGVALGHNVPRIFTLVFAAGTALAGLAGVIGGNYQVTEPAMAFTMGPIVFVVVGVRRARLADRLLHRLDPDGADPDLCRGVRRVAGRPAGQIRLHGDVEHAVCRKSST
jgi:branched-chain amino acid transport system permease protein